MIKNKIISFLCCTVLMPAFVIAQADEWSLQKCLTYGKEHSIGLEKLRWNVEQAQNEYSQSKWNRSPNLYASGNYSYNLGRSLNNITNDYEEVTSQQIGISAGSQVTIFRGLQLLHQMRQREIDLQTTQLAKESYEWDLGLNIATAYLQLLADMEQLEILKSRVETTNTQLEFTQKRVIIGDLPPTDLAPIQSQLAQNRSAVVSSQGSINRGKLSLMQLINYNGEIENFGIVRPVTPVFSADYTLTSMAETYQVALTTYPTIKQYSSIVKRAEAGIKIARSNFYPQLSASARYGSSWNNKLPSSFFDQLDFTRNGGIGLGLNIPIFSRRSVKTAVANAKIQYETAKLDLILQKQRLENDIQTAYTSANNAMNDYYANVETEAAEKISFEVATNKYQLGETDYYSVIEAENRYTSARLNLLRAKYDYLFRTKILNYYLGESFAF